MLYNLPETGVTDACQRAWLQKVLRNPVCGVLPARAGTWSRHCSSTSAASRSTSPSPAPHVVAGAYGKTPREKSSGKAPGKFCPTRRRPASPPVLDCSRDSSADALRCNGAPAPADAGAALLSAAGAEAAERARAYAACCVQTQSSGSALPSRGRRSNSADHARSGPAHKWGEEAPAACHNARGVALTARVGGPWGGVALSLCFAEGTCHMHMHMLRAHARAHALPLRISKTLGWASGCVLARERADGTSSPRRNRGSGSSLPSAFLCRTPSGIARKRERAAPTVVFRCGPETDPVGAKGRERAAPPTHLRV